MMKTTPISFRFVGILTTILLVNLELHAQIGNDKLNFTIEAALPSGRANPAFRNYLNGLVSAHPKVEVKFGRQFYAAIGGKYSYYSISEFKVPNKMRGGAHTYGGFIEAGWNKWQTERFALELGLKVGVAQTQFVTDSTRKIGIQRVNAIFLEPTISFILAADEAVAYRWIVGYDISGYAFKPSHVGIVGNGGFSDNELKKASQTLIVGFGFSYYFKNERSDNIIVE